MLSEEERKEIRAMAASRAIRDEFRQLKAASRLSPTKPVNLDEFIGFLTMMSRLSPTVYRRPLISYARVLL